MEDLKLTLPSSPLHFDHDAHPAFFVMKEVWNDELISVIREALMHRMCYLIIKPCGKYVLPHKYAFATMMCLDDFDEYVRPQAEKLMGIE